MNGRPVVRPVATTRSRVTTTFKHLLGCTTLFSKIVSRYVLSLLPLRPTVVFLPNKY